MLHLYTLSFRKDNLKINKYLFITIFISLILLPLITIDTKSTFIKQEKRNLASFPELFDEKKIGLNINLFHQVDDYLKDRFGFRVKLIQLNADLKYKVLHDSGNESALLGKNEWLYYIKKKDGDNFSDFIKNNLVDEPAIIKFADQIKGRAEWCKKNNIAFIFIIAPNKHNVYPEYYPIERPPGITRTDQFVNYLDKINVEYLYPRDLLVSKKSKDNIVYFETDTHWNQVGAYYVHDQLLSKLRKKLPSINFPNIEYTVNVKVEKGGGDIPPMLGLESFGKITRIKYEPKNNKWTDIYSYIKNEGRVEIITEQKKKSLPKAVIIHDSFFIILEPFTSTLFSKAVYKWTRFDNDVKKIIIAHKPDVIIWEIVERSLPVIPNLNWDNK